MDLQLLERLQNWRYPLRLVPSFQVSDSTLRNFIANQADQLVEEVTSAALQATPIGRLASAGLTLVQNIGSAKLVDSLNKAGITFDYQSLATDIVEGYLYLLDDSSDDEEIARLEMLFLDMHEAGVADDLLEAANSADLGVGLSSAKAAAVILKLNAYQYHG